MTPDEIAGLHEDLEQMRTRAEAAEAENGELRRMAAVGHGRAVLLEHQTDRLLGAVRAFAHEPFSPRARRDLMAAIAQWYQRTQQLPPNQAAAATPPAAASTTTGEPRP